MKQILVMMMVVGFVGCGEKAEPLPAPRTPEDMPKTAQAAKAEAQTTPEPSPTPPADEKHIADPIVEKAIREELDIYEGELTKADLAKVTRLDLADTPITAAALKEVAKLQQLEWLILGDTKITDVGLKEVAKLQKLESVSLNNTPITDASLKEVAKLQKLERLYLRDTQVTEAGVAELRKALQNCNITGP